MPTIDADAHVIESERTWDYIENDKLRPFLITPGGSRPQNWLIDGRVFNRGVNVDRGLPEAIREMRDIEGRLKHMDELEIDVQVLYPSLFLRPLTPKRKSRERSAEAITNGSSISATRQKGGCAGSPWFQ